MWKALLIWLLGNVITPELIKYLLDELLKYLEDAVKKTETPLDDQALTFLETTFASDTLAAKLAAFLNAAIRAKM